MIHSPSFPYSAKPQNTKGYVKVSKHDKYSLQPPTVVNVLPAVHVVFQSGPLASKQPLVC